MYCICIACARSYTSSLIAMTTAQLMGQNSLLSFQGEIAMSGMPIANLSAGELPLPRFWPCWISKNVCMDDLVNPPPPPRKARQVMPFLGSPLWEIYCWTVTIIFIRQKMNNYTLLVYYYYSLLFIYVCIFVFALNSIPQRQSLLSELVSSRLRERKMLGDTYCTCSSYSMHHCQQSDTWQLHCASLFVWAVQTFCNAVFKVHGRPNFIQTLNWHHL